MERICNPLQNPMTNWKPVGINTLPKHIRQGDAFLGRYKDAFGDWQVAVVYFGQHGHCFIKTPLPFITYKEVEDGEYDRPEITIEEWCDIPE